MVMPWAHLCFREPEATWTLFAASVSPNVIKVLFYLYTCTLTNKQCVSVGLAILFRFAKRTFCVQFQTSVRTRENACYGTKFSTRSSRTRPPRPVQPAWNRCGLVRLDLVHSLNPKNALHKAYEVLPNLVEVSKSFSFCKHTPQKRIRLDRRVSRLHTICAEK
jgi:hypothetical protein